MPTENALIAFLIFALIVLVVAYAFIRIFELVPGLSGSLGPLVRLIVGVIALLLILFRAMELFGRGT